jgi:hypothetical protein
MEVDLTTVPSRSSTAKHNLGILFDQFNDVNFYVEDQYKENFYLQIFRKLFPLITIDRIFGLGGKRKVLDAAKLTSDSKKDVYILDQDFDHILNEKENINNTFYLDRYCIENYLAEQIAIQRIVKDENTTARNEEINAVFKLDNFVSQISDFMKVVSPTFLFVRKFGLSIGFFEINTPRDINFSTIPYTWKGNALSNYKDALKVEFLEKYENLDFDVEFEWCKQFFEGHLILINTPGKTLMRLIKDKIKADLEVVKYCSYESFNYRMGNHCDLHSLQFLKDRVQAFLS